MGPFISRAFPFFPRPFDIGQSLPCGAVGSRSGPRKFPKLFGACGEEFREFWGGLDATAPHVETIRPRRAGGKKGNVFIEVISVGFAVFVVGEDECSLEDVADFAGAGCDVVVGAPASGEDGESAFAGAARLRRAWL